MRSEPVVGGTSLPARVTERRRPEKIAETVAREIVRDVSGLPSGSKLPPESVMVDRYQVGRASLREALRILEVQGLIVIRPGPGGGPTLAPVDNRYFARMTSLHLHLGGATYRDVAEARMILEPVMARLAAERQDPDDLAQLQPFVDEPANKPDQDDYLEKAAEFHALLSAMSGNPTLDLMGRAIKDIYLWRFEGVVFEATERRRVHTEHAAIARAVIAGKGATAEQLMREHMQEFVELAAAKNVGIFDEVVDWY